MSMKKPASAGLIGTTPGKRLTLTGFETGIRFANHKDLAATTDDLAVTMAGLGRLKRIKDFHGYIPKQRKREAGIIPPKSCESNNLLNKTLIFVGFGQGVQVQALGIAQEGRNQHHDLHNPLLDGTLLVFFAPYIGVIQPESGQNQDIGGEALDFGGAGPHGPGFV
jgi:hypothetical protein